MAGGHFDPARRVEKSVICDRIEVRSPGRLPNSVTLDNIKLGVHAERNRAIATLLTQLGYMSLRDGSQVPLARAHPWLILRLSRWCRSTPEFEMVGEELRVRIWALMFP